MIAMERIYNLIRVLEKPGIVHHLERDIMNILVHTRIIRNIHAHVEMKLWFAHSDKCFFSVKIPAEENLLGKDISIIVRPDYDEEDRVMRVVIQVGLRVINKYSDEDHYYESDKAVFNHEMRILEHFIRNAMYKSRKNILRGREAF